MKKLKVMMITLMMCLVSMSAWGEQNTQKPINADKSNIIISDTINIYSNNGTIFIEGNLENLVFEIFNLQGIDVTKLNGSLISGGYIVKFDNNKYKSIKIFIGETKKL